MRRRGRKFFAKARGSDGEEDFATVSKLEPKVLAFVPDGKVREFDGAAADLDLEGEEGDVVEGDLERGIFGVEDGKDKGFVPDRIKGREMFFRCSSVSFDLQTDCWSGDPAVRTLDLLALEHGDGDTEWRGRVVALDFAHRVSVNELVSWVLCACVRVFSCQEVKT